uniref:Uncharacterized protein LOC111127382 n=1 Tax=Crassostrea virginica TaxID=6565 RepID=A0A8B8DKY4_CRAVI|nr:uncharacterized protein LOC111127382 [Crassostrea virginica]
MIYPNTKDSAKIALELYVNKTFDDDLNNKSSAKYMNMSAEAQNILQEKFRNDTGDNTLNVTVTGFKNGSVIVLYDLVITSLRGKNESGLNTLRNNIYKAATEWRDKETILGGVIDQSRTKNLNDKTKIDLVQLRCGCPPEYICVTYDSVNSTCQHKCDHSNHECGDHGFCIYDLKLNTQVCQ